ncbi:MAG: hypothetical protein V4584_00215 [Verrucomicrobiota bacterium]
MEIKKYQLGAGFLLLVVLCLLRAGGKADGRWFGLPHMMGQAQQAQLLEQAHGRTRVGLREQKKGPRDSRLFESPDSTYKVKLTNEQFDKYLELSGRKPAALIVGILLKGRNDLREELKNHPDSPEACIMLAQLSASDPEKLLWAERLLSLDPDNGLGHLLKAQVELSLNRPTAGRASLRDALSAKKYESYRSVYIGEFDQLESVCDKKSVNLDHMVYSSAWDDLIQSTCGKLIDKRIFINDSSNVNDQSYDVPFVDLFVKFYREKTVVNDWCGSEDFELSSRVRNLVNYDDINTEGLSQEEANFRNQMRSLRDKGQSAYQDREKFLENASPEEIDEYAGQIRAGSKASHK